MLTAELLLTSQRPTWLLVGGNGRRRTMPLAAEFADEWNGFSSTAEDYRERIVISMSCSARPVGKQMM